MSRYALDLQLSFDHHLCRDTGMVGTGLPQGAFATHPVIADQSIHDSVLKRMTHVQAAGNVWRWYRNAIGITDTGRFKIAPGFPLLVKHGFHAVGIKVLA